MMKSIVRVAVVAIVAAFGGTCAYAQVATQQVSLTATVPASCSIDGGATGTARSADVSSQITNGVLTGASVTLTGSDSPAICNENVVIQLKSANGGLTTSGTANSGFVNKIDYTATAALNGKTDSLSTSTGTAGSFDAGQTSTAGSVSGTLALTVTTASTPGGKLLVAGSYADTLTVQLTPHLKGALRPGRCPKAPAGFPKPTNMDQ